MNKRHNNQMSSIRKKLLAAVAMLLVACIMTVSSTYAWFTLSTAPEVKGITTTVGANGNLEMALGTYETFIDDTADPDSYVGSSYDKTGKYTVSNITWGNLVDLSDASYGLKAITLYPSRLNATGTALSRTSPLQYPKYGSDGRVTELSNGTLMGSYDDVTAGFMNTPGTASAGVSGVGSASSVSKREFAVMNNKTAIVSYQSTAENAAKYAIREYAGTLASIALKYQNNDGTGVVPEADIAVLKNLIAKLYESNQAISDSMKAAVLLVLASSNLTDAEWEGAVSLATATTSDTNSDAYVSIDEFIAALQSVSGADTSALSDLDDKYLAIDGKLDAASKALPGTGDGTWEDIKDSVSGLLVAGGIKISNYTISEVKDAYANDGGMGSDVVKDLISMMNSNSLTYTFTKDSGIFADIATLIGQYTSSMAFPEGTVVEGLDLSILGSKPVTVESGFTGAPLGELDGVSETLKNREAPDADPNAEKPLTDTFGYVVDLLFRTNANDSKLMLQTTPANRVYSEGGSDITQGSGSNMIFTLNAEYDQNKIKGLAAGIRVVFFDTTNTIIAVGALDVDNGTVTGDDYKMDLYLTEFTISSSEGSEGVIDLGAFKEDGELMALTANEKTGLSALVYLDGDVINNEHAGVNKGLTSKLNLQFASSVQLKPMENADLMGQ